MSSEGLEKQFDLLNAKAFQLIETGRHKEAIPFALQAYEIMRHIYGEPNPELATYLTNIGEMYRQIPDYNNALQFHLQAQKMLNNVSGEYPHQLAIIQNNLALVYSDMGKYKESEDLFLRAKQNLTGIHEVNTRWYASILYNMGYLYESMYDYDRAEKYYTNALNLQHVLLKEDLKEDHPKYIRTIHQLAGLKYKNGEYIEAGNLYVQIIGIQCQIFGRDHPSVATTLNNIAIVFKEMENYNRARLCFVHALNIFKKIEGINSLDYAITLNNIGLMYDEDAENCLIESLKIVQGLGGKLEIVCKFQHNLAALYVEKGLTDSALEFAKKAIETNNLLIDEIFSLSSETQRMRCLDNSKKYTETYMSVFIQHFYNDQRIINEAFDIILRRKSIGAEMLLAVRRAISSGRYQHLNSDLQKYNDMCAQIEKIAIDGPGLDEDFSSYQESLSKLKRARDELEAKLVSQIPEISIEKVLKASSRHSIAKSMPEGSLLIEYFRFSNYVRLADMTEFDLAQSLPHYIAFILPAGKPDEIQPKDLGNANDVDELISLFRICITGQAEVRGNHILMLDQEGNPVKEYSSSFRGYAPYFTETGLYNKTEQQKLKSKSYGIQLRRQILDPLGRYLDKYSGPRESRRLFIACDGELT